MSRRYQYDHKKNKWSEREVGGKMKHTIEFDIPDGDYCFTGIEGTPYCKMCVDIGEGLFRCIAFPAKGESDFREAEYDKDDNERLPKCKLCRRKYGSK